MKNYILFIIDSLNYSRVKKSDCKLMPFFEELKKKSIYCQNMFSQAPYTEAAVMNIYCGQNVLDYNGYLRRFADAPITIFEAMKNHGFRTYYNSFQPQCYASSLRRGIDDIYYNVGYDIEALWSYRLSHYARVKAKGGITENDYRVLEDIMNDNFTEWILFVDNIISNDKSCNLICSNVRCYDAKTVKSEVEKEFAAFNKNKKVYVDNLLEKGKSSTLFTIAPYIQDLKVKNEEVKKAVPFLFKSIIRKMKYKDFYYNIRNNKDIFKGNIVQLRHFIREPNKSNLKEIAKSGLGSINVLIDLDAKSRIKPDFDNFKNAPSAISHINHYIDWADKIKEPHFAIIHVDDIHNPEQFFTYDTNDMAFLKKEAADANYFIDNLPKNYKGSISHDLSLRYIDNIIKYFFDSLEKHGLLEDTCVAITADHGFSFSYDPMRESYVTNLYLENYNIPFLIYNSGLEPMTIDKYTCSKDIPATLCKIAYGNYPKEFSGYPIIDEHEYDGLFIEYCGGGCPDLSRRQLKIAKFNSDWFVGALCSLNDDFNEDRITEVYNLKKDPLQKYNNLKYINESIEVKCMIKHIEKRFKSLKSYCMENTKFYNFKT